MVSKLPKKQLFRLSRPNQSRKVLVLTCIVYCAIAVDMMLIKLSITTNKKRGADFSAPLWKIVQTVSYLPVLLSLGWAPTLAVPPMSAPPFIPPPVALAPPEALGLPSVEVAELGLPVLEVCSSVFFALW